MIYIIITFLEFGLFYLFHYQYDKIRKEKTYFKIFQKMDLNYFISNLLFFAISFGVFLLAFVFAVAVPEGISQTKEYFINISGITSNIILIFGGKFSVGFHRLIIKILNKIIPRASLRYLGHMPQMWAFIVVFILYFSVGLCNKATNSISYLAIAIVMGKFLWIDNNRNDIKRLFLSFFDLSYDLCILYIMFSYIAFVHLYNIAMSENINNIKLIYSIIIGCAIHYIFLILKYRNEIRNKL